MEQGFECIILVRPRRHGVTLVLKSTTAQVSNSHVSRCSGALEKSILQTARICLRLLDDEFWGEKDTRIRSVHVILVHFCTIMYVGISPGGHRKQRACLVAVPSVGTHD